MKYEVSIATRKDIAETVTALGRVRARDYVNVGARVSGQLVKIEVAVGEKVHSGQLLAEIDSRIPKATVEADRADLAKLQANLAEQRAQLTFAQQVLNRQSLLHGTQSNSQSALEQAQRDVAVAIAKSDAIAAQIQQTRSTLNADEVQLAYTRLYAPIDGTVVAIPARQGQMINATYSTPILMQIADLSTMTVFVEISEADISKLRPGMPLYFQTVSSPDRKWSATLHETLPGPSGSLMSADIGGDSAAPFSGAQGQNNVVFYLGTFDVANEDQLLRPGMTAQVTFVIAATKDAIVVPISALREDGSNSKKATINVLVNDQSVEQRTVDVGIRTRQEIAVLSGVAAGERVITGVQANDESRKLIDFLF